MSCVYWAPKSRIRTREEWMSVWGVAEVLIAALLIVFLFVGLSRDPVVWRFLGDLHVVHVALAHSGARDAHELGTRAHLGDALAARVAHRGAQAAGELVQDRDQAALVRHPAFDAFGHEFLELRRGVLKISVGGTMALAHGAERAHAAVRLVRTALVELDVPGRLFGPGKQAADHHAVRAGHDRLRDVARETDAPVGDDGHLVFNGPGDVRHGGDLGNSDASNDTRRADRARAD